MKAKNKYINPKRLQSFLFIVGVLACLVIGFLGHRIMNSGVTVNPQPLGVVEGPDSALDKQRIVVYIERAS